MTATLREIAIGGLRIAWREAGSGPTVVLVHGSPLSSRSFRRTIERLAPSHRVLAPDLPGFGRSDKALHGLAFPAVAEVLRGWLDAVAGEVYALVGQHWGGPIALAAARPERVRALVLANTTLRSDFRPPRRWRPFGAPLLGEALVRRGLLAGAARDPEAAAEYARALASRGGRRAALALERLEGWTALAPRAKACAEVPRPTLVAWGDPDPRFPAGEPERLRSALPGAELVRLPGAGRFPQEDAAEAFADAVLSFLARHGVS